ncbi:MAG TPA: hypothetical protein VFU72_07080 [Nitrolancea sp.]|nr:hypothetical protein [Nitrolancea sp.]
MHIARVRLTADNLPAQRAFYAGTLGLRVVATEAAAFTVRAGDSLLTFAQGHAGGPYHLAFNVPRARFQEAQAWLAARAPLLTRDGADEFAFTSWAARACYCADPAGNILECIARQTIADGAAAGPFGPAALRCVSEIGLAVVAVPAAAAALSAQFGLPPYGDVSATFAALGDERGLVILAAIGRPWLPTTDARAAVAPVAVTIAGGRRGQYRLSGYPYVIEAVAR